MQDERQVEQNGVAPQNGEQGDDPRLPYAPPTLTTVESRLSALLGSQCPPNPTTGIPDG